MSNREWATVLVAIAGLMGSAALRADDQVMTTKDRAEYYAAISLAPVYLDQVKDTAAAVATTAPAQSLSFGASATQPQASRRRALDAPFDSPPYPSSDYQGYPLVGIAPDDTRWALQSMIDKSACGSFFIENRINIYGWINGSANLSTASRSNGPTSYWLVPNAIEADQVLFRVERLVDSAQTDHVDYGFRSTFLYGTDYRYMTAGGWDSDQLLQHNDLYGFDMTEQYLDVYVPDISQGLIVRAGRWIACPDIETQFAPDNYMGSHSLLFTFDTYTQTGVMGTLMLDKQWTLQAAIHAGTDMAPWYPGATPTGMAGIRWVALDNNDSVYLVLNAINDAKFRRFEVDGQPAGHDNFNYVVGTWQHTFSGGIHTKTEGYFMWQRDAVLGGTPSIGPVAGFGGGGGIGADIPGTSLTYGAVNYTMFEVSTKDFITVRNELWRDEEGERTGFPGTYTSHSIGLTHNFTPWLQIRPEIGYYRNWDNPAFDNGTKKGIAILGVDFTVRF